MISNGLLAKTSLPPRSQCVLAAKMPSFPNSSRRAVLAHLGPLAKSIAAVATAARTSQPLSLIRLLLMMNFICCRKSIKTYWLNQHPKKYHSRHTEYRKITGQRWSIGWSKSALLSSVPPVRISWLLSFLTASFAKTKARESLKTPTSTESVSQRCTWLQNSKTSTHYILVS